MKIAPRLLIAAGAILASSPAFAHPGHTEGGLLAGIVHPLSGADHLVALTAAGLLWSREKRAIGAMLPLGFVAAMILGAFLGLRGGAVPYVELFVIGSSVLLALYAIAIRGGSKAAALLAVCAGLVHGMAHGIEIPRGVESGLFIAGMGISALSVIVIAWRLAPGLKHVAAGLVARGKRAERM